MAASLPSTTAAPRRPVRRRAAAGADMAEMIGRLQRAAATLLGRLEARIAARGDEVDESDAKLVTALAGALAKLLALDLQARKRRDEEAAGSGERDGDDAMARPVLDALEALVAGRAAGMPREPDP